VPGSDLIFCGPRYWLIGSAEYIWTWEQNGWVAIRSTEMGGRASWDGEGHKGTLDHTLIRVVVTQLHTFVTIQGTPNLQMAHFIACKLYINKIDLKS
jgi:hypothetical protein